MYSSQVPDGLGVRIPGFHPGGPGSIPGLGVLFCIHKLHFFAIYEKSDGSINNLEPILEWNRENKIFKNIENKK